MFVAGSCCWCWAHALRRPLQSRTVPARVLAIPAPLDKTLEAGKESVAEGVVTAASALALAERHEVEMPIARAVARVLFEGCSSRDAIAGLMGRELRPERDG